ncbi:TetR/AcrR family transcriptional regulator [Acrocarpospora corrugata]|nr:TetR/AcrR family transcriptional regulator [Acrocarpospora corrugata]
MARPSDTKARIQEVARELFLRQGVTNTSLRQISERLGITKPALYYHFDSREALLRSVIQPLTDDLEAFAAARRPGPPEDLLADYFDLAWQHRDVLMMIVADLSILSELDLVGRMLSWRETLVTLLIGPTAPQRARIHATVAVGGLSDCIVEYAQLPAEDVKKAAVEAALAALHAGS